MKQSKIRRRLESSLTDGRIATVVRDDFELTMTDGFVVTLTDDWVVLHELADGVHLDDLVMLRLSDVSRVWFRDDDPYHHRAINGLGSTVATFECPPEAGLIDMLNAAAFKADIFAIRMETLRDEPLAIGRLVKLGKKRLTLHFVGRDGVWAPETERWRHRDITRIEVGGRYLDALNRFADPYPAAEPA
ncbi:hypothetical protein INN71_09725 [Nocardioides sp. ChNu-153]|uniref:hypothetical protein n=1 Tax=unclassified Nocardioides TaxID=2615069 RepID=UPI0024075DBF|nr:MULTISPECIES: hypothetical protein [unclassified Nocardioides]MDF9715685.1 hypothetical protein [Nocardioides sp. ChNu-99]MDN7121668.1 hypothetical protein [Nocardioides sp. ChNu-153]